MGSSLNVNSHMWLAAAVRDGAAPGYSATGSKRWKWPDRESISYVAPKPPNSVTGDLRQAVDLHMQENEVKKNCEMRYDSHRWLDKEVDMSKLFIRRFHLRMQLARKWCGVLTGTREENPSHYRHARLWNQGQMACIQARASHATEKSSILTSYHGVFSKCETSLIRK